MHQVLDHADRHARQIGEPLLEERIARGGPEVAHLQRLELERLFRGQMVLANQVLDAANELFVLEHQDLRVKNPGLVQPGAVRGAGAKLPELPAHVFECGAQAANLFLDVRARHDAVRHFGQCPAHGHRRTHRDPRRHADALEEPLAWAHASSFAPGFRCIS